MATSIESRSSWSRAASLTLVVLLGAAAGAQVSPSGAEFQVNTYTTGYQQEPDLAIQPDGGFVVVWQSRGSPGSDPGLSIQARRHAPGGAPLGPDSQVNTYTTAMQSHPAIGANAQGGFVVAWGSNGSFGNDDDGYSVQVRRFLAGGIPLGAEFQVNTYTTRRQFRPRLAVEPGGDFVVVWESLGSAGPDTSTLSIQARRYLGDGTPLGDEFQVNTYASGGQGHPDVASDPSGSFVVVWEVPDIRARLFAGDGSPLGDDFGVNSDTPLGAVQARPAVAMATDGSFVVAWQSYGSSGTDHDGWSVQARRFDSGGVPLGNQFQVNSLTTREQVNPRLAVDANGGWIATWLSGAVAPSGDFTVQARRFDSGGAPLGDEFQISSYVVEGQGALLNLRPSVASDAPGNFTVSWWSDVPVGDDTSYSSIHARRFDALFRDGVESGDTGRWSATVP